MENASKALLIAGAILLCILVIAIGMFIYNGASDAITASMESLSTQEIDAFNNQFTTYQGAQLGSNIKSLMGKLIANADMYRDEPTKLPYVYINKTSTSDRSGVKIDNVDISDASSFKTTYIEKLTKIRNAVEHKHEYWIDVSYQANGLIDYISINYNGSPNFTAEVMHRP